MHAQPRMCALLERIAACRGLGATSLFSCRTYEQPHETLFASRALNGRVSIMPQTAAHLPAPQLPTPRHDRPRLPWHRGPPPKVLNPHSDVSAMSPNHVRD